MCGSLLADGRGGRVLVVSLPLTLRSNTVQSFCFFSSSIDAFYFPKDGENFPKFCDSEEVIFGQMRYETNCVICSHFVFNVLHHNICKRTFPSYAACLTQIPPHASFTSLAVCLFFFRTSLYFWMSEDDPCSGVQAFKFPASLSSPPSAGSWMGVWTCWGDLSRIEFHYNSSH